MRRPRPIHWWARAPRLDWILAVLAGAAAFGLSLSSWKWKTTLSRDVLSDSDWLFYMQTLAATVVGLLGFGAVAIAILSSLQGGQRGKRIILAAGGELQTVVVKCIVSVTTGAVTLAVVAILKPSHAPVVFGVLLAFTVTVVVLRIARLWYLITRMIEIVVLDATEGA